MKNILVSNMLLNNLCITRCEPVLSEKRFFRVASVTENTYAMTCCGPSESLGIERFQRIHGKLDRQKIAPLSYENICDKPCVNRLKACLALRCAEFRGLQGGVIICFIEFMKYCYKCLGGGGLSFWVMFSIIVIYICGFESAMAERAIWLLLYVPSHDRM